MLPMSFVVRDPIEANRLLEQIASDECGGTALFLGTVRAGPDDGPVVRIEYSAYEPMLEAEFGRIVSDAQERWRDLRVSAVHRLGSIATGEASIAVACAAPHRDAAFAACAYIVTEAKGRLPVWKKEVFADGHQSWRANRIESDVSGRGERMPISRPD